MDRLRGSGPQHPRDPRPVSHPRIPGSGKNMMKKKAAIPVPWPTADDIISPRGVARSASRCQQLWCGDFDVAHVLFVAVRRPHTEREGFRHARNVAAE